jgi:hypothetical protein
MGVSSNVYTLEATPTLDTNAYAANDRVGSVMTFTPAIGITSPQFTIQSIALIDEAKQSLELDLLLFAASPTIASADNAAIDITDAQMKANFVGSVTIYASDYKALANSSCATVRNVGLTLKPDASNSFYGVLVTRGAPTYAATSLTLLVTVIADF